MYRCEVCQKSSQPRIQMKKVVMATRVKTYKAREFANRDGTPDNGGIGRETVREIGVCPDCLAYRSALGF